MGVRCLGEMRVGREVLGYGIGIEWVGYGGCGGLWG